MTTNFFDNFPIWALYIITFSFTFLAFETGFRYGKSRHKKAAAESEKTLDGMVGATLGMLAFLLAFVMSIAIDRYDHRRDLVVEEATAIHKTYLQAGYLNQPYSDQIRSLLVEYIDLRIATGDNTRVTAIIERSEEIQEEAWTLAETMVRENPGRDEVSLFLESLSGLISVHTERAATAFTSRLPGMILYGMYFIGALTMMMVGFQNGTSGDRNLFTSLALIFVFTVVFMLIIDLDRPQEGFLQVSQQALIDIQQRITTPSP